MYLNAALICISFYWMTVNFSSLSQNSSYFLFCKLLICFSHCSTGLLFVPYWFLGPFYILRTFALSDLSYKYFPNIWLVFLLSDFIRDFFFFFKARVSFSLFCIDSTLLDTSILFIDRNKNNNKETTYLTVYFKRQM